MMWSFDPPDFFPIVIAAREPEIADAVTLTVCWQHANTRALAFLTAVAGYVPDDLLLQWEVCYRDAEFTHALLRQPAHGQRAA